MDTATYRDTLKKKKLELLNCLNNLGNVVTSQIREKNQTIGKLNSKLSSTDLDYIARYKTEKNKEFDLLKKELNEIVGDIDTIIGNITND